MNEAQWDTVAEDLMNVLALASFTHYAHNPQTAEQIVLVGGRLGELLKKIAIKHLSDGSSTQERKEMVIEVMETAVKIAKGELVP